MIITRIECFPLRIPFKPGKSDASAWGDKDLPTADSLLVKVTTDQGLEGWGEAFGFRAVSSVKLAVNELIAPFCIGKDATFGLRRIRKAHHSGAQSDHPALHGEMASALPGQSVWRF